MRRRKKTRTTFSETAEALPQSRHARKLRQLRRDIAAEAARIMATEAQRNYRSAKLKAAARLGIGPGQALPSNSEVESELRAYQGFYGGEDHEARLTELRRKAVTVMRALEDYDARLVGPVLDGTADQYSRICVHLFSDPPDAVALHLAERGLEFHQEERTVRWYDGDSRRVSLLITDIEGTAVELALFGRKELRQPPPCPVHGGPQKRAPRSEVERLLAGF